jgi:hypothetical protein
MEKLSFDYLLDGSASYGLDDHDPVWKTTPSANDDSIPTRRHPLMVLLFVVALGATTSIGAKEFSQWRARSVLEKMMRADQDQLRQSLLHVQQLQLEVEQRQALRTSQLDRARRMQAMADLQQAEDEARRAAIDASDRKSKGRGKVRKAVEPKA